MKKYKNKNKKVYKNKTRGKGLYDKIVNKLLNPTIKLNNGEKHAIMWNPQKKGLIKLDVARYSGPGTEIVNRIRNNVQPLNIADKVAQMHDIRYMMAKNEKDVNFADQKMVDRLSMAQKNKETSLFNILPSKWGIQAKQFLNKYLKVPTTTFTTYNDFDKLNDEEKNIIHDKYKELEAQGLGKRKKRKYKKRK